MIVKNKLPSGNTFPTFLEKKAIVDYTFWLLIFAITDTGGIISSYGFSIRIAQNVLLVAIYLLFLFASNLRGFTRISNDRDFIKVIRILLIWFLVYFILWFTVLNDSYSVLSLSERLIKTRHYFTNWLLIIPVYYFVVYRGSSLFLNLFVSIATLLTILLLISVFTGINLVQYNAFSRGFIEINRISLAGSDILYLGLYLIIAVILVPKKIYSKRRNRIIIAGVAVLVIYLMSLTRRYYFYILFAYIISEFLSHYLFKKKALLSWKAIIGIIITITASALIFPNYTKAVFAGIETVFADESQVYGSTKKRLSLTAHTETTELIKENLWLGTGYMNEWYSTAEEAKQGYGVEGGDYILLSSLAMFGIVGLVLFLPFYFLLYKRLINSIKHYRRNINSYYQNRELIKNSLLLNMSLVLFFIVHLFSYPNWFWFIGPVGSIEIYVFTGLFFGTSRSLTKISFEKSNEIQYKLNT